MVHTRQSRTVLPVQMRIGLEQLYGLGHVTVLEQVFRTTHRA